MTRRRALRMLRRFRRLGRRDWAAVVRAGVLLGAARTAVAVLPFVTVLRFVSRPPLRPPSAADSANADLERLVWAVDAVGVRMFPRNPCLVQALVVQRLFTRAGRSAELRIGVRRDGASTLAAHAWVESDGRIVIGSRGLADGFVALPTIHSARSDR